MNYALLLINLVCSIIPLLARNKLKGLKWSLSILFVLIALRYNFGEDYTAYYEMFQNMSFRERYDSKIEIGFNILCELFRPIGFYSMVAFLAGVYCFSLYNVIKRYIAPRWYWFCIFCLISNPDLVFVGCSAIRQTTALSIILLSLPFLEQKKALWFFILVALASCFHTSAVFFIVLYPMMGIKFNNRFYVVFIGLSAVLLMTVLQGYFDLFVNNIVSSYFEKYSERYNEMEGGIASSLFGTLIRIIFIILFLNKMLKEENKIRLVFYVLSIVCVIIFVLGSQSMLLRYTIYMGYMMSFCLTYVVEDDKTGRMKYSKLYLLMIMFWNINLALSFANNNSWYEYHTILSLL